MTIRNQQDVEQAVRAGASISTPDLYAIWGQRLPVQTTAKKEASVAEESLPRVSWLQNNLGTVAAFMQQALAKQEYLLVCDVYEEAKAFWDDEARRNKGGDWLSKPIYRQVAMSKAVKKIDTKQKS